MSRITEAAEKGDEQMVMELINTNSLDIETAEIGQAFCIAAFEGYLNIVKILLPHVKINEKYHKAWNALQCAIENVQIDVVRYLLQQGADTNTSYRDGWTTLHHSIDIEIDAAHNTLPYSEPPLPASAELTKLLLEYGARVNAKVNDGMTPLDMARERLHKDAERLLREYGASI